MFPYAFSTNNEEFLISISRLLNLHESVLFFCKIFHASLVPNSIHYWTIEEDMYLLHLLIHAYINQQSLNVSFGKRTIFSCKRRIIYLKKILVHETLIADYIVPEYKKCNGHDCETENNDMQDFNEAILDEKKENNTFLINTGSQTLNKQYQKEASLKVKDKKFQKYEKMKKMRESKAKKIIKQKIISEEDNQINEENNFIIKYVVKRILGQLNVRYDDEEKDFWLSVFLLGKKPFDFIPKLMHGPCINTVKNWIKCSNVPSFDDMANEKNIKNIICWWFGEHLPKYINISIDALKVDEDLYITSKKEVIGVINEKPVIDAIKRISIDEIKNNPSIYTKLWNNNILQKNIVGGVFVVLACPINESKYYPIHVISSTNGFATDIIDQRLKNILSIIRSMGSNPIFISSDSDSHYRKSFHSQFEDWKRKLILNDGDVNGIELKDGFQCNDGSHILKRARSRLVHRKNLFVQRYDQVLFNENQENFTIPTVSPELLCEQSRFILKC